MKCEAVLLFGGHDWLVFNCDDVADINYSVHVCESCGKMKKVKKMSKKYLGDKYVKAYQFFRDKEHDK
ncbi:unnamed protein product, partial [marine sediment metagenome]